jgi:hypothetical protein
VAVLQLFGQTTEEKRNCKMTEKKMLEYELENKTGKSEARLLQIVERIPAGVCQVEGCLQGKYASKHQDCAGEGCEKCSNKVDHGIVGRVLCKYCEGAKCHKCDYTGLFLRTCFNCHGTGQYLRFKTVSPIHRVVINPPVKKTEKKKEKKTEALGVLGDVESANVLSKLDVKSEKENK